MNVNTHHLLKSESFPERCALSVDAIEQQLGCTLKPDTTLMIERWVAGGVALASVVMLVSIGSELPDDQYNDLSEAMDFASSVVTLAVLTICCIYYFYSQLMLSNTNKARLLYLMSRDPDTHQLVNSILQHRLFISNRDARIIHNLCYGVSLQL